MVIKRKRNSKPTAPILVTRTKLDTTTHSNKVERQGHRRRRGLTRKFDVFSKPAESSDAEELEIRRLEKKLGIKSSGKLTKAFAEDGLDGLLEGFEIGSKRSKSANFLKDSGSEQVKDDDTFETEKSEHFEDFGVIGELNEDNLCEVDVTIEEFDDQQLEHVTKVDSGQNILEPMYNGFIKELTNCIPTPIDKYLPPHIRDKVATLNVAETDKIKSEQKIRLQRQFQGLLNRLSESNIENIIVSIKEVYDKHIRHDVISTLTKLVLNMISSKTMLLDQFVILYAAFVAALYKTIGIDFCRFKYWAINHSANFIQTLIEEFEGFHGQFNRSIDTKDVDCNGGKEYSGYQLKQDDPSSLKEIIQQVQIEINKKDPKSFGSRTKFMIETIMNLKNNRLKQQSLAINTECLLRMKKFLANLGKRIHVQATEALRVSLEDIRSIDTKGKWWLGSSWTANTIDNQSTLITRHPENSSVSEVLLNLAKQQKMNTDVRRSIFIVLMSSEDYIDAFERLLKLGLKEVQAREIPRENIHNPYYSLIAQRLCDYDHSFKITFKYCLWDFLRECGESDVGGIMMKSMPSRDQSEKISLRRIVNLAKLFAWLIVNGGLSVIILKTVTFTKLQSQSRLFFQLLFSHIILTQNANKRNPQLLVKIFINVVHNPTLAQGIMFFLHHFVKTGDILEEEEKEIVEWGCDVTKKVIQRSLSAEKIL
ncbi:1519_t:CDS:10 [Dentiscutata heterogama]|uniref:1519_t:CDS:1 n=1 Tax=Dentiscutata heterogama TaxID=1316150 RepID=A0ACA9K7R2_9GLOM|nr:1519_t:CDS:10 [Dentiscutata heterogama]